MSVLPKSQKPNTTQNKTVNLGYKYRLYPDTEEQKLLNHQMFIYNQTYNICLNLWEKEREHNRKLSKEDRKYRSATSYDKVVKRVLRARKLDFKTVVTQQSRINFLKAVQKAFSKETITERQKAIAKAVTHKEKAKAFTLGFPKFKSSKMNPDIQASHTILKRGLEVFGLGVSLCT